MDNGFYLPGQIPGRFQTVEEMQRFNNSQHRFKSYTIATQNGNTTLNISSLSGTARMMTGVMVTTTAAGVIASTFWTIKINSEVVYENVHGTNLNPATNRAELFRELIRGLSGSDSIEIVVTDGASQTMYITFRYY